MTPTDPIQVSRFVEASPQTVFSIISTPEGFSEWMAGDADFEAVAGQPFVVRFPQFATVVSGTIVEVVPGQLLVMTWGVSEGPQAATFPAGCSTVRIELEASGDGTQVTLTQSNLPSPDDAKQHEAGWRFHLSRLQLAANRKQIAEPLADTLSAWCAAWSLPQEGRSTHLERCCVEDVQYADDYATLGGQTLLAAHIAGTVHHVKYQTLRLTGPAKICRGEVLVPWRGEREDGSTAFQGTLHARVGTDGRLRQVTSFWDHVELG